MSSLIKPNFQILKNMSLKDKINLEYFIILNGNKYEEDCLLADYFIKNEKEFILQITNKFSEPFYNKGESRRCYFTFDYQKIGKIFSITQIELNGIDIVPTIIKREHLGFLSAREVSLSEFALYSVESYEMLTFLLQRNT
jgi:hypothetical protein